MTFIVYINKYGLKDKATSNIEIYEVLKKIGLDSKVGNYLRDGNFSTSYDVVNLHPSRGTHWVCNINENYSDSYAVVFPKKLSRFIIKRSGFCLYSEYKIQGQTSKKDSYCACYCLYIIYLTKVIGIDFISAVMNLYYEMIK